MPSSTTTVRTFALPKSLNETLALPIPSQMASDTNRSPDGVEKVADGYAKDQKEPLVDIQAPHKQGITFAAQDKLPKLPIPELESSMKKYLAALKPLQNPREHAETQQAVDEFIKGEGPELQERLKKYATGKTSYIEQFCKWQNSLSRQHY